PSPLREEGRSEGASTKQRCEAAFAPSPLRGEGWGEGPILPRSVIGSLPRSTFPRAPAPHPPFGPFSPEGKRERCFLRAPLHHQLLDLRDRLGRVQTLRTGARAVHDGVAAIQLERVF